MVKNEQLKNRIKLLEVDVKRAYKNAQDKQIELRRMRNKLIEKSKEIFENVSLPYPYHSNKGKIHTGYGWHNPTRNIILILTEEDGFFVRKWIIRLMHSSQYSQKIVKNEKEGLEICNQLKDKYILEP